MKGASWAMAAPPPARGSRRPPWRRWPPPRSGRPSLRRISAALTLRTSVVMKKANVIMERPKMKKSRNSAWTGSPGRAGQDDELGPISTLRHAAVLATATSGPTHRERGVGEYVELKRDAKGDLEQRTEKHDDHVDREPAEPVHGRLHPGGATADLGSARATHQRASSGAGHRPQQLGEPS